MIKLTEKTRLTKYLQLVLLVVLSLTSCSKNDKYEELTQQFVAGILTEEIKADSIENYIVWLQGMGTRYALADNRKEVATKIRNRFISMGYPDTEIDSFWLSISRNNVTYEGWQYNVISTLEGAFYHDTVCIIGAHYDDISEPENRYANAPGANDNASGVAALFEIARVMKKNHFLPNHTIKFIAFGAEETGLNGSYDYAAKAVNSGENIKMMLNNDMIAYETSSNISDWSINIIDYPNSHDKRMIAEEMCRNYTSLNYINDNTYSRYSDSHSFYSHGFKALFFISTDPDNTYHTINDKAINCNSEYCSQVTQISCAMLVYESWWPL